MIYDMLDNMKLYSAISPRLRAALEFARNFDATGPEGRFDMDSEDMYGLVAAYDTKDAAELAFESHEKYADVQILLEGSEYIDVSVGEQLAVRQAYSEDTDTALWEAPKWFSTLSMQPGRFAVFFPHDFHRPARRVEGAEKVRKLVLKVAI